MGAPVAAACAGQWLPRKDGPEQALFPGFSALLLAASARWPGRAHLGRRPSSTRSLRLA